MTLAGRRERPFRGGGRHDGRTRGVTRVLALDVAFMSIRQFIESVAISTFRVPRTYPILGFDRFSTRLTGVQSLLTISVAGTEDQGGNDARLVGVE